MDIRTRVVWVACIALYISTVGCGSNPSEEEGRRLRAHGSSDAVVSRTQRARLDPRQSARPTEVGRNVSSVDAIKRESVPLVRAYDPEALNRDDGMSQITVYSALNKSPIHERGGDDCIGAPGDGSVFIWTDKSLYDSDEAIVVNFRGAVNPRDRITVAPEGAPASVTFHSFFAQEETSSVLVENLPAGEYRARFFDMEGQLLSTSARFSVVGQFPVMLASDEFYAEGDAVRVRWLASSRDVRNRIVIVPVGSSLDAPVAIASSRGEYVGNQTFEGLPKGEYEALFVNGAGEPIATAVRFSIGPPRLILNTDKSAYAPGESVIANWVRNPQWSCAGQLSVVPRDQPDSEAIAYGSNFHDEDSGSDRFDGLPVGEYEVRAIGCGWIGGGSTDRSAPFKVGVPAFSLTASRTPYAPRNFVVATWNNSPGGAHDWVALVPDPEGSHSVSVAKRSPAIGAAGTRAFGPLSPGTYRARYFSTNLEIAESDSVVVPVPTPALLKAVAVGSGHTCGVTQEGTILCWGRNDYGQLGDGTVTTSSIAVRVSGIENAVMVATSSAASCAVLSDGTVWCWGHLGAYPPNESYVTPVQVAWVRDATEFSIGWMYGCALKANGTVACGGPSASGLLGNGSENENLVPGIANAVQVRVGEHVCAVLSTGKIQCWGFNACGALGDGTTQNRSQPVDVVGIANARGVAVGSCHTCAVLATGEVWCWGYNDHGSLGNGTTEAVLQPLPTPVVGITNAVSVHASEYNTCAILENGGMKCWGFGEFRQLGNGSALDSGTPVEVKGLSNVMTAAVGAHSCALGADHKVQCWGTNGEGELGNETCPYSAEQSGFGGILDLSVRCGRACVVRPDGRVDCWGRDQRTGEESTVPVEVEGVSNAVQVSVNCSHTCVVQDNGRIRCWGMNGEGQLGIGTTEGSSTPMDVLDITNAVAVDAGYGHTCAILSDGRVKCWGHYYSDNSRCLSPVTVPGIHSAIGVSATSWQSCAVLRDGRVRCWRTCGLGEPDTTEVDGIADAVSVRLGGDYGCVITKDRLVRCWGNNDYGQLGIGRGYDSSVPHIVPGVSRVRSLAVSAWHACALQTNGEVRCWGAGLYGRLGNGSPSARYQPQPVGGVSNVLTLAVGDEDISTGTTCVLYDGDRLRCWGVWGGLLGGRSNFSPVPLTMTR